MIKPFLYKLLENSATLILGLCATGVAVIIISTIQSIFDLHKVNETPGVLGAKYARIFVPTFSHEEIHPNLNKIDLYLETSKWNIARLLITPIATPSFVAKPESLKNYLEENSISINIIGSISKAYLYIQTDKIDLEQESVYFFIVGDHSIQGNLISAESQVNEANFNINANTNDFLYDMSKLPITQLSDPVETRTEEHVDILEEFFNKGDEKKQYFVGGFVWTATIPNYISKIEIRYKCADGNQCNISVNNNLN